ncbi:ABC transporter ATP-binding protein [Herbiconiux sp. 11R-BC]|uniref:ABC transporter ATP-binding protein n=1 Tax=Herbiconiux sp. 11R-BC TaxID=3111637 RepID=UPI003BFE2071
MSLLEIDDLTISLATTGAPRVLVDGVSLTVDSGQMVGLAGESGSGKTVTALTALGFVPDGATATGAVRLDGEDVLTMSKKRLREVRGTTVAMVFQDPMTSLHPMLSVETQLTEQLRVHRSLSRRAAKARAVEMLELVRIPNPSKALSAYPHHFSGGMRQRIAIAGALACEPKLLIADEVTTALDVTVQAGILGLLEQLRRELGMAVVFITHDLGVMNVTTDELYVMYSGRVAERGGTRQVLAAPRHPYTRALVDALPDAQNLGHPLVAIPGEAATPERRPAGCAFHPRCAFAEDRCRTEVPELLPIGAGRVLACHVDPFAPADGSATGVLLDGRIGS